MAGDLIKHIQELDEYLKKVIYNFWCLDNKCWYKYAIDTRDINLFIFLHEHGCEWTEWTTYYAAYMGHLGCLKYAHENGCPWDSWVIYFAKYSKHLECLEYARRNKCPEL